MPLIEPFLFRHIYSMYFSFVCLEMMEKVFPNKRDICYVQNHTVFYNFKTYNYLISTCQQNLRNRQRNSLLPQFIYHLYPDFDVPLDFFLRVLKFNL